MEGFHEVLAVGAEVQSKDFELSFGVKGGQSLTLIIAEHSNFYKESQH